MLSELVREIPKSKILGDSDVDITGVAIDSRRVNRGDLFVALKGDKSDGRQFVSSALEHGAVAVAAQEALSLSVPTVVLPELRRQIGVLSARVYGEPSRHMTAVGITGTNGKTTTAHLVEAILASEKLTPGYVGTTAYRWKNKNMEASRTTPEAPELQKMLKTMLEEGTQSVVIECSSHGIELGRLNALDLDVALFTNLTPEHLDFHGTMENYAQAKWKLFSEILAQSRKPRRRAVINLDDSTGREWAKRVNVESVTFSMEDSKAAVFARNIRLDAGGIEAEICVEGRGIPLRSSMIGRHNLANLLAAVSVGQALGFDLKQTIRSIGNVSAPGRLERVKNKRGIHLFVDYAHTDDALKNVLEALVPLRTKRLIVVFGCGGDRDRGKRPRMAQVVTERADVAIVTSDNPRSEIPEAIVEEIVRGVSKKVKLLNVSKLDGESRHVAATEVDRKKAIASALDIAREGDIVLIAGKGHETYQEIRGVQYPFDDREVARQLLAGGSK